MSRALSLYKRNSMEQLVAKLEDVQARRSPQPGGLYLLSPKDRKLSEDLAWAITWKVQDNKQATPGAAP